MNRKTVFAILATLLVGGAGAAEPPARKLNVLAVCAHPDDVEYSVGGTLLKYRNQGHDIYIVLTTSGNTGSNVMTNRALIGETREREMLKAAQAYGAKVRFLRNDDERLLDTNETRTQILDAMRWADPDVIFTHSKDDPSPDHRMTSQLVRAMVLSLPGVNQQATERPCDKKVSVFMWDCDFAVGARNPEFYVDISDVFDGKFAALQNHESQKSYMDVFGTRLGEDMKAYNAFRGLQYGCKYAECFVGFKIPGYMPDFRLLPGDSRKGEGPLHVVAIGAHPDDIEQHAGGTLLKYRARGAKIYFVLTTSGNTGSTERKDPAEIGRIREAEQLEAAKAYGAEVRFLRADDERLLDTNEMRTKVLDAMRWADPDVILTHSPTDESPDHWMTAKLVEAMVLSLPGINQLASERPCAKKVSVFTWDNDACVNGTQPTAYVDTTDYLEKKLETLRCHSSQFGYMDAFSISLEDETRIPDGFRGLQYGCKYAECFNGFYIPGYMPDFRVLP